MKDLAEQLDESIELKAKPPPVARHDVNAATIQNWAEAREDVNPVYVDPEAARAISYRDIACPPGTITTDEYVMLLSSARSPGQVGDRGSAQPKAVYDRLRHLSTEAAEFEPKLAESLKSIDGSTAWTVRPRD